MICPHCFASITYKERNYQVCSKCNQRFAFEPKTHPLLLSDTYFSKVVDKLSGDKQYFFTKSQLRFALSRKKLKSKASIVVIVIFSIVTSIIAAAIYLPSLLVVIPFWIILIIAVLIYQKRKVSLPQTAADFEYTVLDKWLGTYGKYPSKLITEVVIPNNFEDDLRGTLICEDNETAICLFKNDLGKHLKLAIVSSPKVIAELPKKLRDLPIYVLHDASADGYLFWDKIRREFGRHTKVIDLGFRPQSVMKSKLTQLHQSGHQQIKTSHLTADEVNWLNQGYYVPTFLLKPEKLIQYVKRQIEKSKTVQPESAEEKAKAVGFMTWVGER